MCSWWCRLFSLCILGSCHRLLCQGCLVRSPFLPGTFTPVRSFFLLPPPCVGLPQAVFLFNLFDDYKTRTSVGCTANGSILCYIPCSHSFSFSGLPVPSNPLTSTSSPFWTRSMTSFNKPIFASARRLKVVNSFLSANSCIAFDPIRRNITMKNVAGFHSFDRRTFSLI